LFANHTSESWTYFSSWNCCFRNTGSKQVHVVWVTVHKIFQRYLFGTQY
jgi:hypothetical protein